MRPNCIFIAFLLALLTSCNAYKQSILFQIDSEEYSALATTVQSVEHNYQIEPFDELLISIYTNNGERLIDPNNLLGEEISVDLVVPSYTVNSEGSAKLPMLGEVELAGLTLQEVNQKLSSLYTAYFIDPFVVTEFANKRVVVLGASIQKVVPLKEGMNLLEVIALAGDLTEVGRGDNIRLLRGDLANPQVHVIDLSTIAGLRQANLSVRPNDVIYIEPARRPAQALRDFTPILGAITSILALIVALNR